MPTVPERFRQLADRWPGEVAFRVADRGELTFEAWRHGANRVTHGLRAAGVGPGDRVALLFDDVDALTFVQAYLGVHQLGAVNVVCNTRFAEEELRELLDHAEPVAVLGSASQEGCVRRLAETIGSIRVPVAVDAAEDHVRVWDDVLADDAGDPELTVGEDDPADILYTAGTTGRPKGVLSRHANATQAPDEGPEDFTGTAWIHASPLASVAGISFVLTPPALGMTTLYLPPPFDPARWLDLAEDPAVTGAFLTPNMVERILAETDAASRDLSTLGIVSVGSAPIAPDTLRAFAALLPNTTPQNNYSLTELGTGFTLLPEEAFDEKAGSVGRPVPPLEVRIADPRTGDELPAGETGEIQARIEGQPRREYFRDPERNEAAWDDGWFHTGDLGHLDDDGFLFVEGRRDDVIIRGGHNVLPQDTEAALYEDPRVKEAAVFGVPDEVQGEAVVAAVVPADDREVTAEELERSLRDRLGDPKFPDRIELVDELPRNHAGKVLKEELRRRLSGR